MQCPDPNCGASNPDGARFCDTCGTLLAPAQASMQPSGPADVSPAGTIRMPQPGGKTYALGKEPGIALLLSLLIPGVGQFYNGDVKRGIIIIVCWVVSIFLTFFVIGFFTDAAIWIWAMINAYNVASRKTPLA